MPALANIVIKKADGTTNTTYTAIAGAAGDGIPAIFRNNEIGSTLAERPTLMLRTSSNGPKTARRLRGDFSYPLTATLEGQTKVIGRMSGDFNMLMPQNQTEAVLSEQAAHFGNLVASAIVKASASEGNAPRS